MNVKRAKHCFYRHFLILAGLLVMMTASAQEVTVKGIVKDVAVNRLSGQCDSEGNY